MADTAPTGIAHFEINAAVVFRLGEELITDLVQALVELVKNSYDADATWVKVTIDTHGTNTSGRKYNDGNGVILVEDDGDGMTETVIKRGWLTLANSPKREGKARGEVTDRGRTPIGDKGLGRLGVQRLAKNVEIITRPRDESGEYYVAFSWHDFRETASLADVPVVLEHSDRRQSSGSGTTLILSDLCDVGAWRGEQSLQDLQRKLSGMISPFQEVRDFVVYVQVDGKQLELAEIAQRVRDAAMLRYTFAFDGSTFNVRGRARLEYLKPSDSQDQQLLQSLCRADGGRALFDFLSEKVGKRRPTVLERANAGPWFVEFATARRLEDVDKVKLQDGSVANPGPFQGEVDAISLDRSDLHDHALDRHSDYRRLVADLAGVRVYRDGFGVRVGEDWLGLGRQWTGGSSYYGLRPSNVLGFVALTARDNRDLLETTSREGFQVTPHYENFYALLSEFVRFAAAVQDFLRRGVLAYVTQHRDRAVAVAPSDTNADITGRIGEFANALATEREKLERYAGSLRRVAAKANSGIKAVREQLTPALTADRDVAAAVERLEQAVADVPSATAEAETLIAEVSAVLAKATGLNALREVLDRRWENLRAEVGALYESVSLGLTAEALSHEIQNIADGLARRSSTLLRQLRDGGIQKAAVVAYVEHVRSSVAAMRKQLAHLTPALRYLRERKERLNINAFLEEFGGFHRPRLARKAITLTVTAPKGRSFTVLMNKGKLTQVFDNLLLNAEYWLEEALRRGTIKTGEIFIAIDPPFVRVRDNGKGVDPAVEETLFDAFVTTKRRGEGRGLGLFVVRQLLDSEACTVVLLPDRNTRGRRHAFEVDLTGALDG